MAKEVNAEKRGFGAKFMHWYESYQGKTVVNTVYSVGASVVIVGALFKILHWPGASQVLMVGMFTEAFLFIIGVLEKPHPEFHWENVFPQLLAYGAKPELIEEKSHQPRPTLLGAGAENGEPVQATVAGAPAAANRSAVPSLSDGELASLKDGITDLAKTAAQLSELGKVATTTTQLGEKLTAAGVAAEKFTASAEQLGTSAAGLANSYAAVGAEMQQVVEGTKAYNENVQAIGTKIGSLNSIYELQLNSIQAQVEAYKNQTAQINAASASVQSMLTSAEEAAKNQEAYSAATKKLAQQVADLNQVYGNMLNALA